MHIFSEQTFIGMHAEI